MRSHFCKSIFVCRFALAVSVLSPILLGQSVSVFLPERHREWQRVVSASYSDIDVNASSLVLEPNGVFRAKFRTTSSKTEEAYEKPGVKYKTRLETIQFDSRNNAYRVLETTLLNSSEETVFTSGPRTDAKWRNLGTTAGKMYSGALANGPFGTWRIVRLRYADGRAVTQDEDAQLALLFGADVRVQFDYFWVGRDTCSKPSYESGSIGNDEFHKWTGKSLKEVGFQGDKLNSLKITCERKAGVAELHYFFRGSEDRATLLSSGVLIDLEKR